MEQFITNKRKFKGAFQALLQSEQNSTLDEAAIPAYAHRNILIDFLFWARLKVAVKYILKEKSEGTLLDFGCGTGVFSELMHSHRFDVTAIDLSLGPMHALDPFLSHNRKINYIQGDLLRSDLAEGSFDVIVALDVLEHVRNVPSYLTRMHRLLKKDGILIISGPTENRLYQLGRKLAGSEFNGHYHLHSIYDIKKAMDKFKIHRRRRLFFPFTLFEVFIAKPL